MRHTDYNFCPVANKPNPGGFCWTDHSKEGCYNSCPQCCPDGFRSVGQALHELNERRGENE